MERETRLRRQLVSDLERAGVLRSPRVAAALRAVPRHRFVPEASPQEAYADRAIALKQRGGETVSSISQPAMIVQMLELLALERSHRVLEIGTGSGYNAALLAELVTPAGVVVTVDVDVELAARAREALASSGYAGVRVVTADGWAAVDAGATFDRVVASARADDIPAAWWDALRDGGRLVAPLRLERAGEFAIGFQRRGKRLESLGLCPCAFVGMRGAAARTSAAEIFFRDPRERSPAAVRGVASVVAVRPQDATYDLLDEADIVIARAATIFGVRFA